MQIYVQKDGQEQGPFSLDEIVELLKEQAISGSDLARYDGAAQWGPVSRIPGVPFIARKSVASSASPPPVPMQGDATGGVIPYKNPHALIGYYLGIFGLFPVVGIFLAIPAVILGISGLKKKKRNPIIKGSVHAWIAIVLGVISTGYNSLFILLLIAGLASHGHS